MEGANTSKMLVNTSQHGNTHPMYYFWTFQKRSAVKTCTYFSKVCYHANF